MTFYFTRILTHAISFPHINSIYRQKLSEERESSAWGSSGGELSFGDTHGTVPPQCSVPRSQEAGYKSKISRVTCIGVERKVSGWHVPVHPLQWRFT